MSNDKLSAAIKDVEALEKFTRFYWGIEMADSIALVLQRLKELEDELSQRTADGNRGQVD